MPQYLFISLDESETTELFYSMKEAPAVGTVVEVDGVKWKRIFTLPQAAPNGLKAIDPFSQKQFRDKTASLKGTLGDMFDLSKEMKEAREQKTGTDDPVQQKFFSDWSKKKRGMRMPAELALHQKKTIKAANEKLKKKGITLKLNDA